MKKKVEKFIRVVTRGKILSIDRKQKDIEVFISFPVSTKITKEL